ncbi:MAG: hypothetical protein ACTHMM_17790 [Agriterribacter sp.]
MYYFWSMNLRTIKVCAGIGDSIWLFQKLINCGERFHFQLPNGKPQRGKQIFDLLPKVAASAEYVPGLSYSILYSNNVQNRIHRWEHIKDQQFYLSCNAWLERGKRIEAFLPDLPTSFLINYDTTVTDKLRAEYLVAEKKHIGIYGSSYSSQRSWGFWDEHGWHELIKLFHRQNPELVFVIIGASFDEDLAGRLMQLLLQDGIPFINTIGEPLSVVIEILKRLSYFVGFPSGLSILNETLGMDGFMFYPKNLIHMMNAWADPARIESGQYKGAQFCTPEKAFDWIKNDFKLFNKLHL